MDAHMNVLYAVIFISDEITLVTFDSHTFDLCH